GYGQSTCVWIAADPDAGALPVPAAGELPHRLVSQCAGTGYDSDISTPVDVPGGNADAAATVGVLPLAGGDEARAIRPNEAGLPAAHGGFHLHHVIHGDAFGN